MKWNQCSKIDMNRNCVLSRTRLYQCCTLIASLFISKALLSPSWVLLTTACQPSTDAFNPHFITFPTCAFFFFNVPLWCSHFWIVFVVYDPACRIICQIWTPLCVIDLRTFAHSLFNHFLSSCGPDGHEKREGRGKLIRQKSDIFWKWLRQLKDPNKQCQRDCALWIP